MASEGLHGPAGQDLLAAGVEDGAAGAGGEAAAAAAELLRNGGDLQEGGPQTTLMMILLSATHTVEPYKDPYNNSATIISNCY